MYTYWVSVQNWFTFGPCWPNSGPLVATKWMKMVFSNHYLKKYSRNPTQTWCVHSLAPKWLKLVVSDCYLEKYSHNTIQTWCVYLLDECSQLIRFWAMLAKFCPFSGQKINAIGWKWSFPLVCTLIGWVFRIDSLLGHVGHILAL